MSPLLSKHWKPGSGLPGRWALMIHKWRNSLCWRNKMLQRPCWEVELVLGAVWLTSWVPSAYLKSHLISWESVLGCSLGSKVLGGDEAPTYPAIWWYFLLFLDRRRETSQWQWSRLFCHQSHLLHSTSEVKSHVPDFSSMLLTTVRVL